MSSCFVTGSFPSTNNGYHPRHRDRVSAAALVPDFGTAHRFGWAVSLPSGSARICLGCEPLVKYAARRRRWFR